MESLGTLVAWLGPKAARLSDQKPTLWMTALEAVVPIVGYVLLAPLLWLLFRRTWRELDVEAHEHQRKKLIQGEFDYRPAALFVITAVVLTLQEEYGGRSFYQGHLRPFLAAIEGGKVELWGLGDYISMRKYSSLYSYAWWSFARVFGYIVVPFVTWKVIFPRDSLMDMGLRLRGLLSHAWIYMLSIAVVVPAVFIVGQMADFANYYPFYKLSSRSYFDLLCWEVMYFAQFFALEVFFRGFWLSGLRKSLGSGAIFAMSVPYCMIHYGKPYLEAAGAVVAGIFLGSLAMRTKSIYSGFLVHITIALLMDFVALYNRNALPTSFWGN